MTLRETWAQIRAAYHDGLATPPSSPVAKRAPSPKTVPIQFSEDLIAKHTKFGLPVQFRFVQVGDYWGMELREIPLIAMEHAVDATRKARADGMANLP